VCLECAIPFQWDAAPAMQYRQASISQPTRAGAWPPCVTELVGGSSLDAVKTSPKKCLLLPDTCLFQRSFSMHHAHTNFLSFTCSTYKAGKQKRRKNNAKRAPDTTGPQTQLVTRAETRAETEQRPLQDLLVLRLGLILRKNNAMRFRATRVGRSRPFASVQPQPVLSQVWLDWATIQFRVFGHAATCTGSFCVFGPVLSSPAHGSPSLPMAQI
jgi:hypothetical protein